MASTIAVPNETTSTSSRSTKDGRRIRYDLQVIQQPERARACGSGAKSSADRRPVDPPPIVELRVFENDQEITFAYNANFFLHASLENARAIAPGRAPPTTPSYPVLTGTPVAGMAYLDRPCPAGYFIFPDLSVRHEGKYRLSFALFENLSEVKDLDPEDPDALHDGNRFVTHRAEVKSAPFTVFSAKKFPGLSESTALSRMVAEQGCRVRIRRDVRMRRRETKAPKDWDEYEDEPSYEQARRTSGGTPNAYEQQPGMPAPGPHMDHGRPRSTSNASNGSLVPARRTSMEEMAQAYQQPNNSYQQMPPPQSTGYQQMSSYPSSQPAYQHQYASTQSNNMMQPPQSSYTHQASQSQHQSATAHSYQSHPGMQMNQPYGYQSYQQTHYEPRQEQSIAPSPSADYRRPSMPLPSQQYSSSSPMAPPYSPMDQYQPRSQSLSHPVQPMQTPARAGSIPGPSMHAANSLPTLKTLQPPIQAEKLEAASPSYNSPVHSMPSTAMSASSDTSNSNYALSGYQNSSLPPMTAPTNKRSFSSTFDSTHVNQRMVHGARPSPSGPGYNYDEPDMEEPMDRAAMSYRRADGTQRQRHVPEVSV